MMMTRKFVRYALFPGVAMLGLSLAACSGGATPTPAGQGGTGGGGGPILQAYRGASGQFVENYNPLSPTALGDVNGLIYERLFFFNNLAPLGTPPVPELGKSYELDKTGKVLTVQLQQGVKWSDGQAFTAKDVAFTFNLMRKTPALNTTGNTPEAKATGDTTVTLTFDSPGFADAPTILGSPIVSEHIFSKMKDVTTDVNKNPVGTGPMKLGTFSAQSYLFNKSDTFRDAAQVAPKGIRYYSLSGNEAATNKLLAGDLDWAGIFIPDVDKVTKPFPNLHSQPTTNQQVQLTTCSSAKLGCTGPQTDPAVRQAMAAAIDRDQVNKLAYYGKGIPISPTFALPKRDVKFIDPQFPAEPMQPDVAKAKSLLEADGWKMGADNVYAKDGQRLSMTVIVVAGYTDYIAALDIIKSNLAQAGIEIKPQQQANAEVTSVRSLGKFQLTIDGMFEGPVGDPYYIYNGRFSSATVAPVGKTANPYGNLAKFSDPTVDAAIKAAGSTSDLDVKAEQYKKIQAVIVPNLPYVPIINNQGFGMYSDANYTGWKLYNNGIEQTLLGLKAR